MTKCTVQGLHSTPPEVMSMLCSVAGIEERLIMAISSYQSRGEAVLLTHVWFIDIFPMLCTCCENQTLSCMIVCMTNFVIEKTNLGSFSVFTVTEFQAKSIGEVILNSCVIFCSKHFQTVDTCDKDLEWILFVYPGNWMGVGWG